MKALVTHPVLRSVALIFAAGATVAALAITAAGIVTWSYTERFAAPYGQATELGVIPLTLGVVGSTLLFLCLLGLRRLGAQQRWVAVLVGGLLFAAIPGVAFFSFETSWLTLPLGMVAGFMLSRRDGKVIGWIAGFILLLGLGVWTTFVINQRADERAERLGEEQRTRPSILGARILGGAALGLEIWLFNERGKTVSFDLRTLRPTLRVPGGVTAIQSDGNSLWLLVAPPIDWRADHQAAGRFRLAHFDGQRWENSAVVDYGIDQRPIALVLGAKGAVILGPQRLYTFEGLTLARQQALSMEIQTVGNFVGLLEGRTLYLGANRGEWGGGVFRIDTSNGAVAPTERRDSNDLCAGPLNSDCNPVTGLVPDPSHPGCVFASVGLSHMMWTGRVLRVCGSKVEVVLEVPVMPIGEKIERFFSSRARERTVSTEPFFGLVSAADGFWGVTPRALYHWTPKGVDRRDFPKLTSSHGLSVSTALPGLFVVSTDANAAYSMSGVTPLVFATRAPSPRPKLN